MSAKKPCKLCVKDRFANQSFCYTHYRQREKERRLERAARKKARRLATKTYIESQRGKLRRKLDRAFSLAVRRVGECQRCGRGPDKVQLQCSHIYTRANLAVRWDLLNATCLCAACHRWWHQNPKDAIEWLEGIYTPEKLRQLTERARVIKQWTVPELQVLLNKLECATIKV